MPTARWDTGQLRSKESLWRQGKYNNIFQTKPKIYFDEIGSKSSSSSLAPWCQNMYGWPSRRRRWWQELHWVHEHGGHLDKPGEAARPRPNWVGLHHEPGKWRKLDHHQWWCQHGHECRIIHWSMERHYLKQQDPAALARSARKYKHSCGKVR